MKKKMIFSLVSVALGTFVMTIAIRAYFLSKKPLLSPTTTILDQPQPQPQPQAQTQTARTDYLVYGFLPYWTVQTAQLPSQLSHVAYFSVTLKSNGTIATTQEDGTVDVGWSRFKSEPFSNMQEKVSAQKQKTELVVTMMDADTIATMLTNETYRTQAINTIMQLFKTQPIDGVNIDIEYAGDVTPLLQERYTQFIADLSATLKKKDPNAHLSIDVFADSAAKTRIWNIEELAPHVDHIVVMAYDFFRSSSPQSGPVSPVFGSSKNKWDTDIMKNLKVFLEKMPSQKILLGVPFYGYEWQTVSEEPGAATYPKTGGMASYKRIQELLLEKKLTEQWDKDALAPYITYRESGKIWTAYYENSQSLSYKLDLVKQADLGGIAIWALGYEGTTTELWDTIQKKLRD